MSAESKATIGDLNARLNQAKYCSVCGKETDSCECQDQAITISICIDKSLLRGLSSLTSIIPKIQISSNRCTRCGHTAEKCSC